MAKMLGDHLKLAVHDASGSTFSMPLGQGNLTINRSNSPIDLSDKDTGNYGASAPGPRTLTISLAIQPNLPDAAFTRMKTLDTSGAAVVCQVLDVSTEPDAVMFECSMYIAQGNTDAPTKGVTGSAFTLSAAAAPTVDLI